LNEPVELRVSRVA